MSDDSLLATLREQLDRLLAAECPPARVREIERGEEADSLWRPLQDSGFLDAMLPEAAGGAGLTLAEAATLFAIEGRHVLPLPMAHTMLVRALLERAGLGAPPGPIAIAPRVRWAPDGGLSCPAVPNGRVAEWVAAAHPGGWLLLPVAAAERCALGSVGGDGVHGSLRADLQWAAVPPQSLGSPKRWPGPKPARRWRPRSWPVRCSVCSSSAWPLPTSASSSVARSASSRRCSTSWR